MAKKIILLGSTGSIGTQSLDVARMQGYEVVGLAAHSRVEKLLEQVKEFRPRYVAVVDPSAADRMERELGEPATAVATGGLARFITPLCRHKIHYDDALLLKGLLILYRKNA